MNKMQMYKETAISAETSTTMIDYIIDFGEQYTYYLKFSKNSHGVVSKKVYDNQVEALIKKGYKMSLEKIESKEVEKKLLRGQIKYALNDDKDNVWTKAFQT